MSFRKRFQRQDRSALSLRRGRRPSRVHVVPAAVEHLEERTLLSAIVPGLTQHGEIYTNSRVAGQVSLSISNEDFSGNAGVGLVIDLNNQGGQLNNLRTIRLTNVSASNNTNAGIHIRLVGINLDRLEIDRAVLENNGTVGRGGSGLVIELTDCNIGELLVHDSTNPEIVTGVNDPNSRASLIAGNQWDGIVLINKGINRHSTLGNLRIAGNVVENNVGHGIYFDIGGPLGTTISDFSLEDNEVSGNRGSGVQMFTNRTSLAGGEVVWNTITGNLVNGLKAGHGIGIFTQNILNSGQPDTVTKGFAFTTFDDNIISDNQGAGVSVDLRPQTTMVATLLRNDISRNGNRGFEIRATDTESAYNLQFGTLRTDPGGFFLDNNLFDGNAGAGISLDLDDPSGKAVDTSARFQILGNRIINSVALAGSNVYRGDGINIRARGSQTLKNGAARFIDSVIDRNTLDGNANDGLRLTISEDSELENLLIGNSLGPNQTFDINGPNAPGGDIIPTVAGDGNVATNNGGNGISVIRDGSAYVKNIRILDNILTGNQEGLFLLATGTFVTVPNAKRSLTLPNGTVVGVPLVSEFFINHNDLSSNRSNGLHLRTEADAVILADLRYNRIDGNGTNGIRVTGLENNVADFENVGGTWVKNAITNNGQNGIEIQTVVGSVNPLLIGRDGFDAADNQSFGNYIAFNGEDGIEVGSRAGAANTEVPRDVRDSMEIINNLIVSNGQNNVGNPYLAGKGIDIEVVANRFFNGGGATREFRIDRNTISLNAGDGIEMRNAGGQLRWTSQGNFIDLNGGRGVDLLNQSAGFAATEAYVRFGGPNAADRNIITNNGLEGFYVVNTPANTQTQDVNAEDPLAFLTISGRPGEGDWFVNLLLDYENNEIRDNGGGVPELNSPPSTFATTGLVIRFGSQNSATGMFTIPDLTGTAPVTGNPAAAGVGTNDMEGGGTVERDYRISANGRVNARIVDNEFSGNVGDDVLLEGYLAIQPRTTNGNWDQTSFQQAPTTVYDRDPLARMNLEFHGNTGDSLDVVRVTNDVDGEIVSYTNDENVFKSRTNKQAPNVSGPHGNAGGRNRLVTRVAGPAFTPGTPPPADQFWYDGWGQSTLRIEGNWETDDFDPLQGDDFDELWSVGNSPTAVGWAFVGSNTFSFLTASINDVTVNEGQGTATLTVTLSEPAPVGGLTINWRTSDGSAVGDPDGNPLTNDGDFKPVTNGFVSIAQGATTGTITVSLQSDLDDIGEQFYVDLFSMSSSVGGDFVDTRGIVTVVSPPRVNITDVEVIEDNAGEQVMNFTVTLTTEATVPITIDYSSIDVTATAGEDYQFVEVGPNRSITFQPGQTTQIIQVRVFGDTDPEAGANGTETFIVKLSNATGGAILADDEGLGTITDDDRPILTVAAQPGTETDIGDGKALGQVTFTFVLSRPVSFPVTFNYDTVSGSAIEDVDFAGKSGTVTFLPGQTTQTVTVNILADNILEVGESFTLALSNASGVSLPANPTGDIIDDDRPLVTIGNGTVVEPGNGGATQMEFKIRLSDTTTQPVVVTVSTADLTATAGAPGVGDYQSKTQSFTFNPGEQEKSFFVTVFDDALLEGTEQFTVNIVGAVTNGNPSPNPGVGSITDDDTPLIIVEDVAAIENEGFVIVTVRLSRPLPSQFVTVDYSTRGDTATPIADYLDTNGTLTFQPGQTEASFFVSLTQDLQREPLEQFFIDFTNPVNGSLTRNTIAVRILDRQAIGLVTSPNVGQEPLIRVYDARGNTVRLSFYAYNPGFRGGVRVATGDVNGDNVTDIITAPVRGAEMIRVFDGSSGALLREFFPYSPAYTGGISLAVADVNGDGRSDIIAGLSSQGNAVRIFSGLTGAILASYNSFAPGFLGGVNVAAGDVDGDGRAEVIVGIASGTSPWVRVMNALAGPGANGMGSGLATYLAFGAGHTGGITVAAGDVNGDGRAEVIAGIASREVPAVRVFEALTGAIHTAFLAFSPAFRGGVTVGVTDINFDGRAEILVAPASGSTVSVRFFDGRTGALIKTAVPYPTSFTNGAWVAGETFVFGQALNLDGAAGDPSAPDVTQAQVDSLVQSAIQRLADAGAGAADLAKLANVKISISDLPGGQLALERPAGVLIDVDAAGHGWFVDSTPDDDAEFARGTDGVYRAVAPQAVGKVDLLTALTHELAHAIGLPDFAASENANSLMTSTLARGVRRATREHLDDIFADCNLPEALLTI